MGKITFRVGGLFSNELLIGWGVKESVGPTPFFFRVFRDMTHLYIYDSNPLPHHPCKLRRGKCSSISGCRSRLPGFCIKSILKDIVVAGESYPSFERSKHLKTERVKHVQDDEIIENSTAY